MKMKTTFFITLLLSILSCEAFGTPPAVDSSKTPAAGRIATAEQLLELADRALGETIQMSRISSDPNLSLTNSAAKPFWQTLKTMNESLDRVRRGLILKDKTLFSSLHDTQAAAEAANVTFNKSGAADKAVERALGKMVQATALLSENFGLAASLKQKERPLSGKEQKLLKDYKEKQRQLESRIKELEVKQGADRKEIAELRRQSNRIRDARYTSGDLAGAIIASSIISGIIWGNHWWWGDWWWGWGPGFFVGWIDISYSCADAVLYDWALTDVAIDVASYDLDVAIAEADLVVADTFIEQATIDMAEEELTERFYEELAEQQVAEVVEGEIIAEAVQDEIQQEALRATEEEAARAMEQEAMRAAEEEAARVMEQEAMRAAEEEAARAMEQEAMRAAEEAFEEQMIDAGSMLDDW